MFMKTYRQRFARSVMTRANAFIGTPTVMCKVKASVFFFFAAFAISVSSANAQCPHIGASNGCGVRITVSDKGPGTALRFDIDYPVPGTFDNIDDTLVGVVNNSSQDISSIGLRAGFTPDPADPDHLPIFAFDGDGICSPLLPGPQAPGCPFVVPSSAPPGYTRTGYEGLGVWFERTPSDLTSGIVHFDPAIAKGTGTAYFGLESKITKPPFSCPDVIGHPFHVQDINHPTSTDNPKPTLHGIEATFKPIGPFTLAGGAVYCGFKDFNWLQRVKAWDQYSNWYATINKNKVLDSTSVPYNDPPQGGLSYKDNNGVFIPRSKNSYPFYYYYPDTHTPPVKDDLGFHQDSTKTTLSFEDLANDVCLPGGIWRTTQACSGPTGMAKGYDTYETRLVGIVDRDTAIDLGIGFTWDTNTTLPQGSVIKIDPSQGSNDNGSDGLTGGVTIRAINNVTNYHYNGIGVTAVNDVPIPAIADGPPVVTISVSPSQLWPPRPWLVPVTVSGTITDLDESKVNPSTVAYAVEDEYGLVQPKGPVTLGANGQYLFTVELQPTRRGDDKDGRLYTIRVSAADTVGNLGSSSATVIVPHDEEHHRKHRHKHDREHDRDHDREHDRGHDQRDDQDHDEWDDRRH
jgi:hypothetical protein